MAWEKAVQTRIAFLTLARAMAILCRAAIWSERKFGVKETVSNTAVVVVQKLGAHITPSIYAKIMMTLIRVGHRGARSPFVPWDLEFLNCHRKKRWAPRRRGIQNEALPCPVLHTLRHVPNFRLKTSLVGEKCNVELCIIESEDEVRENSDRKNGIFPISLPVTLPPRTTLADYAAMNVGQFMAPFVLRRTFWRFFFCDCFCRIQWHYGFITPHGKGIRINVFVRTSFLHEKCGWNNPYRLLQFNGAQIVTWNLGNQLVLS